MVVQNGRNDIFCYLLILILPKSFDPTITVLDTVTADSLTLSFVKGKVLNNELTRVSQKMIEQRKASMAFTNLTVAPKLKKKN